MYITSKLKEYFNILIGHPHQAIDFLDIADLVIFRNTGSVLGYQEYFDQFLSTVEKRNIKTFNSLDGKADIRGKQYLLDLTSMGFNVIPTIASIENLEELGVHKKYIVKIKNGADSIGMEILTKEELLNKNPKDKLIQPLIDFEHEVSFYYLNKNFQYALYAPDKTKRWELVEYKATSEDLDFAAKFIEWNNIKTGITRVDACRCTDNSLLLVELEDLNPYLSIELLSKENRDKFISNLIKTLKELTEQ